MLVVVFSKAPLYKNPYDYILTFHGVFYGSYLMYMVNWKALMKEKNKDN